MKTIAEKVAEEMGNDGQRFYNKAGKTLEAICEAHECWTIFSEQDGDDDDGNTVYVPGYRGNHFAGDPVRYLFDDGSAIVEAGDGWDIEGDEPFFLEGQQQIGGRPC